MRLALVLLVMALVPQAGWACSCIGVGDESGFAVPAEVQLPSNAHGLLWQGLRTKPEHPAKDRFVVRRLDAGGPSEVPFHFESATIPAVQEDQLGSALLVVPDHGLAPGGLYEFKYLSPESPVQVVKARVSSGALHFPADRKSPLRVWKSEIAYLTASAGVSCQYGNRADQRGVEIELPEGVREWEGALLYLFFVDGQLWKPSPDLCTQIPLGKSWVGLRKELLFSFCGGPLEAALSQDNLAPGPHRLEALAWLPGTGEVLRAATELNLGCRDEEPGSQDR